LPDPVAEVDDVLEVEDVLDVDEVEEVDDVEDVLEVEEVEDVEDVLEVDPPPEPLPPHPMMIAAIVTPIRTGQMLIRRLRVWFIYFSSLLESWRKAQSHL
jgi:hypothetical protein